MKFKSNTYIIIACIFAGIIISSCQQPSANNPGSEYMPDMAHSVAYEANHYVYYYNNRWGTEEEYHKIMQPRKPVNGSVPRGFAGGFDAENMLTLSGQNTNSGISVPVNGNVPFNYANSEEARLQAATDIVQNPFPISDKDLASAKELYNTFCGICHGEKGDGAGYLVREGGAYPAQPANFLLENYVNMSNGQYYFAIMHGKNVMGGYSDKLSYKERWDVIHYIRALQASELKLEYTQAKNTLNNWATPLNEMKDLSALNQSNDMHDKEGHDGKGHEDNGTGHNNDHH